MSNNTVMGVLFIYAVVVGNGSCVVHVFAVLDVYDAPEYVLDASGAWDIHPASENPRSCLEVRVYCFVVVFEGEGSFEVVGDVKFDLHY